MSFEAWALVHMSLKRGHWYICHLKRGHQYICPLKLGCEPK